jgi:hypothetical protein
MNWKTRAAMSTTCDHKPLTGVFNLNAARHPWRSVLPLGQIDVAGKLPLVANTPRGRV